MLSIITHRFLKIQKILKLINISKSVFLKKSMKENHCLTLEFQPNHHKSNQNTAN